MITNNELIALTYCDAKAPCNINCPFYSHDFCPKLTGRMPSKKELAAEILRLRGEK